MVDLAMFCKKKGFIYPSSEIYGGISGLYDYGHLGTRLKKNFENLWRKYFLGLSDYFYEIETANIMHENVFRASGHLENFIDPVAKCSKCDNSERADHLVEKVVKKRVEDLSLKELTALIKKNKIKCSKCKGDFKPVSVLNMMFPLQMGVGDKNLAYLRPETAQSPYVNFKLQHELLRKKMPLGLGLIGRAYRNEISPRNLTLRQREFTQAELQIFFNPKDIDKHPEFSKVKNYGLLVVLPTDRKGKEVKKRKAQELVKLGFPEFYVYHLVKIQQFYLKELKVDAKKFRFYQLNDKEKAFYNKYHFDLEIELNEHGWTEMGGLHYRTDYDLKGHQKVSGQSMEVLDEESGLKYVPHVLELSFGVDRHVYALLDLNCNDDKKRGNVVLKLNPGLAPYLCAVFPLVKKKPELVKMAKKVHNMMKSNWASFYDETGSVGRRYARADEVGVALCITVDFESLDDKSVTIRNRDNTKQIRVSIEDLVSVIARFLEGKGLK